MLSTTTDAIEYRRTFREYYLQSIAPILEKYEPQRKIKQIQQAVAVVISVPLCAASLLVPLLYSMIAGDAEPPLPFNILLHPLFLVVLGVSGVVWAVFLGRNFENLVKKAMMPLFLSFFGDFIWKSKEKIPKDEFQKSMLIGDFTTHKADDYFEGTYRDSTFVLSECGMLNGGGKYQWPVFGGIFVKIDLHKNVISKTIIAEKSVAGKILQPIYTLPHVNLEDPEFEKMFDVYSQDQVGARYLLNPAFIERFKQLKDVFKAKYIRASFVDNSFYIAIQREKDTFKLADLRKPITDSNQMQEFFEQFVAILSIIDILKLNLK